ncbi:tetratricopeptide repeat protein [Chitinophaga arvensicola]|uniref:Tetratricopeptide repeat-containing protein n=1 Tax=Chitinophaga arvensicola TaxID=29529 RepID=A0A1I0RJZ5_9BACT|nr:tetratricopeptide repeat protein [Chitinophaga arvensicola]SEW41319.1 Tetratricopeptide repeat-containing protein [Chitinophaga arvensicola]
MLSNKPNNEKVLKIFSSIRCLSKDQLPRYMEGRLTDVERHLVEQHLTDCDLCYDALQALEKQDNTDQYHDLTGKLQRYVQNSIQPVSHVHKVAQYTRKEKNKEHMLVYFWIAAFIGLGVGSVYVLRGHMRNQPPIRFMAASVPPVDSARENVATNVPVVTPTPAATHEVAATPVIAAKTETPLKPAVTPVHPDSAAIKKAAALKALQKKHVADSIHKQALLQKQADSLKKEAADKASQKDKDKTEDKKPDPKPETAAAPKEKEKAPDPEPAKRESTAINSDEYLYKAAMVYQQQGNLSEAIDRYRRIESVSSGKYVEMARYQLAICYRSKGQMGKARRMFKEVIRMDGSLKNSAQQALDGM